VSHPLHGVEDNVNSPVTVNAVVEIPEGQNGKFELDEESGLLRLDRVLATPVAFPINYGFLPKTIGLDNDPLDMMIISSIKIPSLMLVDVRVLGVMRMIDTGEVDDKLIGVPEKDPIYSGYKDITDVPVQTINKIKAFFETYKILDNKKVTVVAFEGKMNAYATIEDCQSRYKYIYGH
jgi:inorganic pyrophosphatase